MSSLLAHDEYFNVNRSLCGLIETFRFNLHKKPVSLLGLLRYKSPAKLCARNLVLLNEASMRRGESIEASLQHVIFFPDKTESNYATIVALHGRGADAYDLLPLVESLGFDDLLVIAPRAPRLFEFGGGYAWYDLSEEGVPDPPSFNESLQLLREFLVEIRKSYPMNPNKLILLGFSQGTVMSYAAGLLDPTHVRGIVALSGYIPSKSNLQFEMDKLSGLPVFISHGAYDELIPLKLGLESAELLRGAGANVTFREYAMGHQVTEDTLRDLSSWLRDVLS